MTSSFLTPDRWQQVQDIMLGCLESEDRRRFLDQACAGDAELRRQVEQLLSCHEQVAEGWLEAERPDDTLGSGSRIGHYRLDEPLGTGGMGEVFSAFRSDDAYRRQVAIKILRPGLHQPGITSRFLTERQILANIQHPHIAQLLDGGETASGRPYLVMERVEGQPIDSYCDHHRLTVRQRLELFCKVCDAVEVAHQNLVVHRDLKPSNILVSEAGEPKLLDFGIAKILDPGAFPLQVDATETGLAPMTPRYAAPEQLNGDAITTATDVYSLGVMLYELLTGRRPYRFQPGNLTSMIEAICRQQPRRPSTASTDRTSTDPTATGRTSADHTPTPGDQKGSTTTGVDTDSPESSAPAPSIAAEPSPEILSRRRGTGPRELRRQLAGDLDAIVLKALRKSPAERYRTVSQLSRDIRCHLNHLPVSASRGSMTQAARKFIRRHRWGVAALVFFAALMIGFTTMLWLERQETAAQRDRFEEIAGFLTNLFEIPNPTRSQGRTITARELLDKSVDTIDRRFVEDSETKADLKGVFGESYAGLGLFEKSNELLSASVAIYHRLGRGHSADAARRRQQWADSLAASGAFSQADRQAGRALEDRRAAFGEEHPEVVASLVSLAEIQRFRGEYQTSAALLRQAATTARPLAIPETLSKVLAQLALAENKLGRWSQAEKTAREALAILGAQHGDFDTRTARMLANLATIIQDHHPEEAESLLRRAQSQQRRLFPGPHPDLALSLHHLGRLLSRTATADAEPEAELLLVEAVAMNREIYGQSHPVIAIALQSQAELEIRKGDLDTADQLFRDALLMLENELGEGHMEVARCRNNYARLLFRRGDAEGARAHIDTALKTARHVLGDGHPEVASILSNAASLATHAGELERAVELRRPAIDIVRSKLGPDHPNLGIMLFNQSIANRKLGQLEAAVTLLEQSLPIRRAELGDDHPTVGRIVARLALLHLELESWEAAERRSRQGLDILARHLPAQGRWHRAARRALGTSLMRQGRLVASERELSALLAALENDGADNLGRLRFALELLSENYRLQGLDDRASILEERLRILAQGPEQSDE